MSRTAGRQQPARRLPGYAEARRAAQYIVARGRLRPKVGIILGSGLGGVADRLRAAVIPYGAIPHFPRSTVRGHAGELHLGKWARTPVAILAGRLHLYEGYHPAEVVLPTRALALAGIEILIVTCAAGGIAAKAAPGSWMAFSDHLNFQSLNPLAGLEDERLGTRFVDLTRAYDPDLRALARRCAGRLGVRCSEGVYAALLGPSFETPAEIRALKRLGADAVGMSAVPEVIAARQLNLRVLALASITNRAAGLSRQPLSHEEVLAGGNEAARQLGRLLDDLLAELSGQWI